jgi:glycosyltransferase involved in cell wall biosynthesis
MTDRPHICYVTTVHPLHDHRFLYKQCRGLAEHGYRVSFVVPTTESGSRYGVEILPLPTGGGRLRRLLRMGGVLRTLLRVDADAYHLADVELLPVGLILKALCRRRCMVYDDHEDMVAFIRMKSYLPRPVAWALSLAVAAVERLAERCFDAFVLADPAVAREVRHLSESRKHIFYNVPVLSLFKRNPIPWQDRDYDVVLLGTMSVTSGGRVLLDALRLLKASGREVRGLVIGQPAVPEFERLRSQYGLEQSLDVTGRIDYDQVPALLDRCRVGLITLLDLPKFRKNIATKMFEYMAKSLAIVSSDLPPERRYIREGEDGLLVEPGNAQALANAIAMLLDHPERGAAMGRAAREHLLTNGWYAEREMERLATFYDALLEGCAT